MDKDHHQIQVSRRIYILAVMLGVLLEQGTGGHK